jgi:hypothetical protein
MTPIPEHSFIDKLPEHPMHDFAFQLPYMMEHIVHGELRRGKYVGIHFFQEALHRVEEMTKPPNQQGVWEARINIRHHKTKVWGKKEKASTFFPLSWDHATLVLKLEEAFANRKRIYSYKYVGQTHCGVTISFVFRDQKVVSCFPLYT